MTVLSAFMGRRHRSFVTQMQCSIEIGLHGSRARGLSMHETMNGPELAGRLAIPLSTPGPLFKPELNYCHKTSIGKRLIQ